MHVPTRVAEEAPSLSKDTIRRLNGWRSHRKEQTNKETDGYDQKTFEKPPFRAGRKPDGRAPALRTQDSPAVSPRL